MTFVKLKLSRRRWQQNNWTRVHWFCLKRQKVLKKRISQKI